MQGWGAGPRGERSPQLRVLAQPVGRRRLEVLDDRHSRADPTRSTITPKPAFAITNALFVRDYVGAFMVTLNDAVPLLALESVAEHLTAVRPIGSRLPDFGTQVTGTWPSLASLAVTA